jgi:DNA-directed RNA polymerase subunit M/transcription elongation factor TFIIS
MTNYVTQNINQVVDLEAAALREIERVAESLGMVETDDGWAACPVCDEEAVRFYSQFNKRGDNATGLFYCPACGAGGHIGHLRKLFEQRNYGLLEHGSTRPLE